MSEEKVIESLDKKTSDAAEEATSETMADYVVDRTQPIITLKKLAAAGVQYGHQTRRWNPKMKPYIYGAHKGIYIIDLKRTAEKIEAAYLALHEIAKEGGKVMFVGTKPQVKELVAEQALRSGSFYMNNRWLGGTLTNFKTILNRIRYLRDLERLETTNYFDKLNKKEASALKKKQEKLLKNFAGIKEIRRAPQALFVVDPIVDLAAVKEAKKLGIPVFGIVDTNCDPDLLDYIIPGNDDAIGSVRLILQVVADAIIDAKGGVLEVAYTNDEEYLEKYASVNETRQNEPRGDRYESSSVTKQRTTHSQKPTVGRTARNEETANENKEEN